MTLKGAYDPGAQYSVDDVVLNTDNVAYRLQHPASSGTPPTDTRFWGRLGQDMSNTVKMIVDMFSQVTAAPVSRQAKKPKRAAGGGEDK